MLTHDGSVSQTLSGSGTFDTNYGNPNRAALPPIRPAISSRHNARDADRIGRLAHTPIKTDKTRTDPPGHCKM